MKGLAVWIAKERPITNWKPPISVEFGRHRRSSDPVLLSITNKMQHYTIFFIIVNALHVPGSFSTHHQELKNCTHSIRYMPSLLAAAASMGEFQLIHASGSSKQNWHILDAVFTVF
jgi:hypothetical protein